LSDNIVQTGEPPNFTAQVSGFLFPFQVLSDFMNSEAQLIDQGVALNNVAVAPELSAAMAVSRAGRAVINKKNEPGQFPWRISAGHSTLPRHADI